MTEGCRQRVETPAPISGLPPLEPDERGPRQREERERRRRPAPGIAHRRIRRGLRRHLPSLPARRLLGDGGWHLLAPRFRMIRPCMSRTARYAATLLAALAVAFVGCRLRHQPRRGSEERSELRQPTPRPVQLFPTSAAEVATTHLLRRNARLGPEPARLTRRSAARTSTSAASDPRSDVLYAIENGGFSGAYMPQNIVVGTQAREIANFIARYAGRPGPLPEP